MTAERNEAPDPPHQIEAGPSYHEAIMWAFSLAADSIEEAEYGGADSIAEFDLHRKAAKDVAVRIRQMADRYHRKHLA